MANRIRQIVGSLAQGLVNHVAILFTGLKNTAGNIWSSIKNMASSAWNGLKDLVVSIAGNLRQTAVSAFQNMVSGIRSALSSLVSAVSDVADKIRSFLHFSVPDEGPLTDYESWMPDFMGGLAKGIENSRGLVEKAVRDVASDMVISPKVGAAELASMEGGYGGMGNMADFLAGIRSAVSEVMAGFAGQAGDIIIPVYVGGTLLDEVIVGAQARQSLRSGGR